MRFIRSALFLQPQLSFRNFFGIFLQGRTPYCDTSSVVTLERKENKRAIVNRKAHAAKCKTCLLVYF